MKHIAQCAIAAILLTLTAACGGDTRQPPTAESTALHDTIVATADTASQPAGEADENYATVYVVVADTSQNYYTLQHSMYELGKQANIAIDTMDRYYDAKDDRIELPEDSEDDVFAGDYFPRRVSGTSLSLEYYHLYDTVTTPKNIALVTGLYDTRPSADSMLAIVLPHAPKSFVKTSVIYVGCIH